MPLATGTQLGTYEILGMLGEGGMGAVYRARDHKLGREVAIKTMHADLARKPEQLARFEREGRVLANLNHPNIATLFDLGEADGLRFLIMELVPGRTLADWLSCGPLAVDEALRFCNQIAAALEAAHEKGIIHRDLKPANIKVAGQGKVKVLDFGLARSVETDAVEADPSQPTGSYHATRQGVILGTPAYMSPEQARGKQLDKRTDIFSFGAVLFEVLTGKQAFTGETFSDVLAAVLERDVDWNAIPRNVPQRVVSLLQKCLRKDPNRRLREIGEARIELEEAAQEVLQARSAGTQQGQGPATQAYVPTQVPTSTPQQGLAPMGPAGMMPQGTAPLTPEGMPAIRRSGANFPRPPLGAPGNQPRSSPQMHLTPGANPTPSGGFPPQAGPATPAPGSGSFPETGMPPPPAPEPGRSKMPLVLGALVVAAAACALGYFFFLRGPSTPTVAVLPFATSSDEEAVYKFSDDLAAAVTDQLSQSDKLRVTSKDLIKQNRDNYLKWRAQDAGRSLKVGTVLKGKVTQQSSTLVIECELIDVETGSQLWSGQFKRPYDPAAGKPAEQLAKIQEELAKEIAEKVQAKLGEEKK